jgi:hypothetical protein
MADLSDVENAIVSAVAEALYPQGLALGSVVGATCRVYRGWPSTAMLNSDLAAGVVNVTVFPTTTSDEVPDPYFDRLYTTVASTSLVTTIVGRSVTFSGVVAPNQIVGLLVDGSPYAYSISGGDTTESIAANLTILISADRVVILSGSTLTLPESGTLTARVVTNATVSESLRRQRREIQVSCWCPSPALRDSVPKTVDLALTISPFIALSDETKAHIHYVSTHVYDQPQNSLLFRRDLCYKCEYTVISTTEAPVMLFGDLLSNGRGSFL